MKKTMLMAVLVLLSLSTGCALEEINDSLDKMETFLKLMEETDWGYADFAIKIAQLEEQAGAIDWKDPSTYAWLLLMLSGGGIATNTYKNRKKPE